MAIQINSANFITRMPRADADNGKEIATDHPISALLRNRCSALIGLLVSS
jgi:hypothetical protein